MYKVPNEEIMDLDALVRKPWWLVDLSIPSQKLSAGFEASSPELSSREERLRGSEAQSLGGGMPEGQVAMVVVLEDEGLTQGRSASLACQGRHPEKTRKIDTRDRERACKLFVTLASDRGNANEGSDLDNPLELGDIMPQNRKLYDKMRPPKYKGNATEVNFHVTVMSLDTIDESSMVGLAELKQCLPSLAHF
eukprot:TCALIF_06650-PB protein Name:"Protein of unknown function" AED:0.81 eAED:0.84 QI:0/0.33/0.25/0.5/0/0.25/4/129/192